MVYQRRSISFGWSRPERLQAEGESDEFTARIETLWLQLRRGRLHQPQYHPALVRPAVDVYQTQDEIVVLVEAPGMRDQEVRVEFDQGRLTIWGEKRNRSCGDAFRYHQMEIASGAFSRTVDLPDQVDAERATLRYEDGYVEIRLPRVRATSERLVRLSLRQR